MVSVTDDLITWLRVQLDEDERLARAGYGVDFDLAEQLDRPGMFDVEAYQAGSTGNFEAVSGPGGIRAPYVHHVVRHDPSRVLAEVDAKRRILDWLAEVAAFDMPAVKAQAASREEWYLITVARTTIKLLALPYADRDGYREEWRP